MRPETIEHLFAHYKIKGKKLEDRAREWMIKNIVHPCAISMSWGKDSIVATFLSLPALNGSDWVFSVCAGQYDLPDTESVKQRFMERFAINYREYQSGDYFEVARKYGLNDVTTSDKKNTRKEKKTSKFEEACQGAASRVWGLRAEESKPRRLYARHKGMNAFIKKDNLIALSPVLFWTWEDIWSVMLANNLPYNEVYDKYDEVEGLARARSNAWAGTTGAQMGRIAYLKMFYPDLYNRFAKEFPEISSFS